MDEKDFERSLKGFKKVCEQRDSYLDLADIKNELENITKDFEKAKDRHYPSLAEPPSVEKPSTEKQFQRQLVELNGRLSGLRRKSAKYVAEKLKAKLKDFGYDHHRNYKCKSELKAIRDALANATFDYENRLLALPVETSDFEFDKTLRDLNEKLSDLKRQWESHVLKGSVGIGDSIQQSEYWALEEKLQIYSQMFEMWQKLREQRADYNKEFFSKLFISTLVAILLPLLASTGITALTPLLLILLTGVLAGAVSICGLWAVKLWALWQTERAQRHTLKMIEKSLNLPFHTTQVLNASAIELTSTSRPFHLDLDYYGLPAAMAIIFFSLLLAIIGLW